MGELDGTAVLGRCANLPPAIPENLGLLPPVAQPHGTVSCPTFGTGSGHLASHKNQHMHPPITSHIRTPAPLPKHTARSASLAKIIPHPPCVASGIQPPLPTHAHAASTSIPHAPRRHGFPEDECRTLLAQDVGGTCDIGGSSFGRSSGPFDAHQCRRSGHTHSFQSQDLGQRSQGAPSPTSGSGAPSGTMLPTCPSQAVSHQILPRMCIDQDDQGFSSTVCAPSQEALQLLFCQKCRHRASWQPPPGFFGQRNRGASKCEHDEAISTKFCHVVSTPVCFHDCPDAPLVRECSSEDVCFLTTRFQSWLAALPTEFPKPHVDSWASFQHHALPLFGVDFFRTTFPKEWVLWLTHVFHPS